VETNHTQPEQNDRPLRERLTDIAAGGVSAVQKHLQLAALEAREEAEAWVKLLLAGAVTLAIAVVAFLLFNVALLVLIGSATKAWAATSAAMGLFYLVVAAGLAWRILRWWRKRPAALQATTEELDKTKEWLRQLWPTNAPPRN